VRRQHAGDGLLDVDTARVEAGRRLQLREDAGAALDQRDRLLEGRDPRPGERRAEPRPGVQRLQLGEGEIVRIPAPRRLAVGAGLDDRTIGDLAVSLDGARVAIASGGEVLVGIVVRDADRPNTLRIDALRPLPLDGGHVTAVKWAGPTTLATLVRAEGDVPEVYRVELARSIARLAGPVAGATWLAASPGRPLAVGTDDGKILRQEDTTLQWVDVADAVAPAYPG